MQNNEKSVNKSQDREIFLSTIIIDIIAAVYILSFAPGLKTFGISSTFYIMILCS